MNVRITVTAEYDNQEEAEIVMKALEPENESYVYSEIQGSMVRFHMESDSISTALNTADDLIFSEMIVESMIR
ncbi:MAG: KEOPS complex subunit Pcc1 [Methanothermobacter wolfeii]|nr:KEOPS complex subunit Pcc1 [Methanothermobacter wolfeii]